MKHIKWLVATAVAIVGFGLVIIGLIFGGKVSLKIVNGFGMSYPVWVDTESNFEEENKTYNFTASGEVTTLNIDSTAAEITIEKGDSLQITTSGIANNNIKFNEHQNTIDFSTNEEVLHLDFFNSRSNENRIIITVPESLQILDINLSFGSINMDNLTLDTLYANVDFGSLRINHLSANVATIDLSSGDLIGNDLNIKNNLDASNDFGKISLNKAVIGTANFDVSSGKLEGTELDILNNLSAENDFGDVELSFVEAEEHYFFDLEVDFGNAKINGEKDNRSNGNIPITIDVSSGSIRITTK